MHDERLIEQAQQRLLPGQISYIPEENQALEGLGQVNTDLVRELARRGEPQKMATIDLDSTVIESWKQEAQPTEAPKVLNGRGRCSKGWDV